jgi:hypothetical protein
MILIVSPFLRSDLAELADDCIQGGMRIALVWLRPGNGKRNGRARRNGGRRLLLLVTLVGVLPRMILVVRNG